MRKFHVAAAVAALTLTAASATGAQAVELLSNGGFELGGGSLTGWSTTGSVGALTAAQYGPCCGTTGSEPNYSTNHFASFGSGNVSGLNAVSQSFGTVAGRTYTVSFDHGAFGGGWQGLDVLVNGVSQGFFNAPAINNSDLTWIGQSFSFVGNGSPTTLSFQINTTADNVDALLDNVSVSAVPEPATWAMMIIGFGAVGGMVRNQRRRETLAFA